MSNMFTDFQSYIGDISKWDVSSVTDMYGMFRGAVMFNGDISKWVVSSVKDMSAIFLGTTRFNSDISKWDVSSVKDMSGMFDGATAFKQTLCGVWVNSKAWQEYMLHSSPGSICTTRATTTTTLAGKHVNCLRSPSQPHPCLWGCGYVEVMLRHT